MHDTASTRTGLIQGLAAYLIWGVLPLYIKLLHAVPSLQVLAHRILWSGLLLAVLIVALRQGSVIRVAARGRVLPLLCLSAMLITVNWFMYIWAIANAHVLAASVGYFINPLINVALGVIVLGERVRPVQWVAVGLAAAGVLVMAVGGSGLWISLTMAVSFGLYGLVRKVVAIGALGGLAIETLILSPFAAGVLVWAGVQGRLVWAGDTRLDLLLAFAGVVTAVPLLLFAGAARRLRYSTLGLLQYLAPSLAFLEAVLLFGEPLRPVQLVTFGLIWAGCAVYAWDSVRAVRAPADGEAAG